MNTIIVNTVKDPLDEGACYSVQFSYDQFT